MLVDVSVCCQAKALDTEDNQFKCTKCGKISKDLTLIHVWKVYRGWVSSGCYDIQLKNGDIYYECNLHKGDFHISPGFDGGRIPEKEVAFYRESQV